jgi:4a-hydroxytetrahydrobiopterin dehydratase
MRKVPKRLTLREIKMSLKALPGWVYLPEQKALGIECKLKDFKTAIRVIQRIAKLAEKANHHPHLYLTRYRYLQVTLSTHASGGVTRKDFRLAKQFQQKGMLLTGA